MTPHELYEYLLGFYSQAGIKGLDTLVKKLKPASFFSWDKIKYEISFSWSSFTLAEINCIGRKKCLEHGFSLQTFDEAMDELWRFIQFGALTNYCDPSGDKTRQFMAVSLQFGRMAETKSYGDLRSSLCGLFCGEFEAAMSSPPSSNWILEKLKQYYDWLSECMSPQYDLLFFSSRGSAASGSGADAVVVEAEIKEEQASTGQPVQKEEVVIPILPPAKAQGSSARYDPFPEERQKENLLSAIKKILDNKETTQEEKARLIIHVTGATCGFIALQPIPFADVMILTPIQAIMFLGLGKLYGFNISTDRAKEIIIEIFGVIGMGIIAQQAIIGLYKTIIPFAGGLFTVPLVWSFTYGMGRVGMYYFDHKASGKEIDRTEMKNIFKQGRIEGAQQAKQMEKPHSEVKHGPTR